MSAAREFTEVSGGDTFELHGARVVTRWLNHPQGCLGFRFETPGGTIAYATDNEPGNPEFDRNLRELAEGADIFINDAQYTAEANGARTAAGATPAGSKACASRSRRREESGSVSSRSGLFRQERWTASCARRAAEFENSWAAAEGMVDDARQRNHTDVVIPSGDEGLRREAQFPRARAGLHAGRTRVRGRDGDSRPELCTAR